jgi:hypothetical protein
MRPGPAAGLGLLSGAAAQAGTAAERPNGVQRKGEETEYDVVGRRSARAVVKALENKTGGSDD